MSIISRWLILIFSFLGIADSAYLADSALTGVLPTCRFGSVDGCKTVAQSAYSHLFGIPLGVYGVVFYTLLFILSAVALLWIHQKVKTAIQVLAVFGVLASLAFIGIQIFLIKALCLYCVTSAALTVFILIAAFWRQNTLSQESAL